MDKGHSERSKVRLSLDVSPQFNERLEKLAEITHSSKSDVLRKAFALMDVAVEARQNGQRLFVTVDVPPGTSREIIGI